MDVAQFLRRGNSAVAANGRVKVSQRAVQDVMNKLSYLVYAKEDTPT
jgi:hypothetical protein